MNRADLERNELADRLEQGLAKFQPAIPVILGGVALVIVGSLFYGLYAANSASRESSAWTDYYFNLSGSDADTYKEVADGHPGSTMAGWAMLAASDNLLYQGVEALYSNRQEGEEKLAEAITGYKEVADASGPDELKAKALLGLGKAHEALGQIDEAIGYLEQFAAMDVPPQVARVVNERLSFLNSTNGKEFYAWFSKLEPKPSAPMELPNLELPPTTPNLEFGAPEAPAPDEDSTLDPNSLPPLDLNPSSGPDDQGSSASDPKEGSEMGEQVAESESSSSTTGTNSAESDATADEPSATEDVPSTDEAPVAEDS